jgi:hypothetical protein
MIMFGENLIFLQIFQILPARKIPSSAQKIKKIKQYDHYPPKGAGKFY